MHKHVGIDVGTGTTKVCIGMEKFMFPSVIATGFRYEFDQDSKVYEIGETALKLAAVRTIAIKQPVHRGEPTSIDDYCALINHALERCCKLHKNNDHQVLPGITDLSNSYCDNIHDLIVVAGLPQAGHGHAKKIIQTIKRTVKPKIVKMISQSAGTLFYQNATNGIVCHIGHGTTEIMVMVNGVVATAYTISSGVSDISRHLKGGPTNYTDYSLFSSDTKDIIKYRRVLADRIQNELEKIVLEYTNSTTQQRLPLYFAGGGSQVPGLLDDISNDIISNYHVPDDPIYSNALGMLKVAKRIVP